MQPWELDDSGESSDEDYPWGEEAADVFVNYVLDLVHTGKKVSAKDGCLLCCWAHRAGADDKVGKIGFHPNAQSGKYQRHLDQTLDTTMRSEWYTVDVPGHDKYDSSRSISVTIFTPISISTLISI